MDDFITASTIIDIKYYTVGEDVEDNKIEENPKIESKIIISTTNKSLKEVTKASTVRIYFFIKKDESESCNCFEYDPFSESITFTRSEKRFILSKTIDTLKIKQKIIIRREGDELDQELDDLYEKRQQ